MNREEKIAIVERYGFMDDPQKWFEKYSGHVRNAPRRGLETELSFDDYVRKAKEAGINSVEQIGKETGRFGLGRIGDTGPYTNETCRFITSNQNHIESSLNGNTAAGNKRRGDNVRGRTKETHEYIRKAAEKQTGQTKENSQWARNISASLAGRTKETHEDVARRAELLRGRTKETHSYIAERMPKVVEKIARGYEIIDPQGNVHVGKNLAEFCRQNNLTPSNMSSTLNGKVPHHKGFRGRYVD